MMIIMIIIQSYSDLCTKCINVLKHLVCITQSYFVLMLMITSNLQEQSKCKYNVLVCKCGHRLKQVVVLM